MFKKIFLAIAFLGNALLYSQNAVIKGKVLEDLTGQLVPFANISVEKDSVKIASGIADIDGNFTFGMLRPGKYTLKASSIGYQPAVIMGINLKEDSTLTVNLFLKMSSVELNEIVVFEYNAPLINPAAKSGYVVTREEFKALPQKNMNSVSATTSGVVQKNGFLKLRGSRSERTAYYIDGQKVITGGVPANYGDASGGIANIFTRRKNRPVNVPQTEANAEEYNQIVENEFMNAKGNPLSTFSIDVDRAAYSNVRRFITDGMLPPKDAVRIEEMINYFSYSYPKPKEDEPFSINLEASECPWNKKHQLVHIGLQGKKIETENLPPNNLVFLMDVSGSMNSPDKLPLLKSSFKMLAEQLRKEDRVSIVVYAGAAGEVLSSTHGDQKEKIFAAIDQLQAGGSTAGGEGILLAYKIAKDNFMEKGNNRVILATDGDFNVGVSDDDALVKLIEEKRNDGIFLTVLGFGTGNYKDAKMEQLADKGNGNFAYIDNILEGKKVLVKEMGGTLVAIAKDVKIQVEFNPANVKAYRLIGYENRMLAAEDFNDDKKDAGEIGSGHTVTALYEIIPASSEEEIGSVDSLKYQTTGITASSSSNELMTIKFRYKEPKENKSKLLVQTLNKDLAPFEKTSENFRFAASVAEFALILRDSKFKSTANYKEMIEAAKASKGKDEDGYRSEFIRLGETAEILQKQVLDMSKK